jgi:hypothetical protein
MISQVNFLPAKKLLVHVENIPGYVEKPLPAKKLLVTDTNSYVLSSSLYFSPLQASNNSNFYYFTFYFLLGLALSPARGTSQTTKEPDDDIK